MREILFRGKSTDGWNYGNLLQTINKTYINTNGEAFPVQIVPETVGQYTGMNDKNGVKIFEGDILHCVSKLDNAKMVVIFECGEYRMVLAEKFKDYIGNCGFYAITCFEKEVIGNIHDSPELLEGDTE